MSEILIKNATLQGQQVDIQISGDRIIAINPHPKDEGSKMIMHMTGAMKIK